MKSDIVEVDYAETNNLSKGFFVKKTYGYIEKGGGSASGQNSGNPENNSKPLPVKSKPNSKKTLYKNGKKIRERYYDEHGLAKEDIDYTNHGNSKHHPKIPHKHKWDWSNPNNPIRSSADD